MTKTPPSSGMCRVGGITACSHCGLPVPAGLIEPEQAVQFCCHGCATVYSLIHERGLDDYYRVREAMGDARPTRAATTGNRYEEFDDEAYALAFVESDPDGTKRTTLMLEGLHCAACVWLIERLPRVVGGVIESRLDLRRAVVSLRWDPARVSLAAIARSLDSLGYPAHPPKGVSRQNIRTREDREHLVRVGVAGALAGNAMLLALALHAGMFEGIEDQWNHLFRALSAVLGVASLAWPGRVFFKGAIAAVRTRTTHLDLPIAIALFVGGVWGTVNVIRGSGEVYFDSLTVLVFFLLVGRWLQHAQQRRSIDSVELLFTMTPTRAKVLADLDAEPVAKPMHAVNPGDLVLVAAGETVPVDGVIVRGATAIDQSLVTGESRPISASVEDAVLAGTVNQLAPIIVRTDAVGEQTRVGRLMALVADAAASRSRIVQLADRLAGRFVVIAMSLAILTTIIWWSSGPTLAIEHATALLIVTCPCALGLATPLVFSTTLGRLARRGVLVKGGDVLERMCKPGVVLLDKTGTVTHGRMSVLGEIGPDWVWPLVGRVERSVSHPIATALAERFDVPTANIAKPEIAHVVGSGLIARVEGRTLTIGSLSWVSQQSEQTDERVDRWIGESADHETVIAVAVDGRLVAAARLGDVIRADSRPAIDALRSQGWRVEMLSGDRSATTESVARTLGLDGARGQQSPEDKLAEVRARVGMRDRGTVVMVGDGVNDAAALAAAEIGIAVHGGAEASLDAADVYMREEGLSPILQLHRSSRHAMLRVKMCIGTSLTYNIIVASLAMAGMINALLAAVLMPMSSLAVLAIATSKPRGERTGTHRERDAQTEPEGL